MSEFAYQPEFSLDALKEQGHEVVSEVRAAVYGLARVVVGRLGIVFSEESKPEEEAETPAPAEDGTIEVTDQKVVASTDDTGIQTIVEVHTETWHSPKKN